MSIYQVAHTVSTTTNTETLRLANLLRWRAKHQSEQLAYSFKRYREGSDIHITYAELDRQARTIAAELQRRGASGKSVLLLHPPGIDYISAFFGCLYAGAIAVPAYPPASPRMAPRIQTIALDAQATTVLTTASTLASVRRYLAQVPHLQELNWIATDVLEDTDMHTWQEETIDLSEIAFLQYTSGSTGAPKGVMVTHGNLFHNLSVLAHIMGSTVDSHMVSWLPPYHDMGLICGILMPFFVGFPATLMAPVAFLQRPLRWLEALSSLKANISIAPNSAYALCCDKITPEQRATLDLSNWEIAACGSEPVHPETIERFSATFQSSGFRQETFFPGYGMAEMTLVLATNVRQTLPTIRSFKTEALKQNQAVEINSTAQDARRLVGYQQIAENQRILIVDPETRATCTTGSVGEIWVSGPSVAKGYWGKPSETEQTFAAYTSNTHEGPFLRTGDLGFFSEDGVLFIGGRHKDLIIINGNNHYPQDIEFTLEKSHAAIRPGCSVAFSIEAAGNEQLAILVEIDPRYKPINVTQSADEENNTIYKFLDPQEVRGAIRAALVEEHALSAQHIVLLQPGSILKTSSGKLQRRVCRAEFLAERLRAWDEQGA